MKKSKIIKEIEKHMKAVAKERDALDEFISNLESLEEDCERAYQSLECARDDLSRLV
jgi:hypothetical protein